MFERRGDVARPGVQITDLCEGAEARVDEVEAPAPKLSRKRLRLRLHPEDGRPPLARRLERLAGGVDPGDDGAELRELGGRLTRSALQMQDALLVEVGERVANRGRKTPLPGERLGALPVDLVPRAPVVFGRFHQTRRE